MSIDFFKNGTATHCTFAKQDLNDFLHFHHESEALWFNKDEDLQEDLESHLNDFPKERHDEILGSYTESLYLNQQKYPAIHRQSILITLFSFLENQLNELCNKLAVSIDSLIKLRDVNGKGVTRALMYMKKVAQLDLQKASDEKYYIAMLNKIRNAIVHTGGILHTEPSSDIYRFINNEIFISISADGALIIHDDFIDRFIGILIGFFDKLDSEIQMFIERYDAQPNS